MEFTLLGAVAMAVVPLYGVLYWEAKRGNAASCSRNLWDVALVAAVVGIFVGRIASMFGNGVNPLTHPADLLIIRGGVATGPAALAALITMGWIGRNELWMVADGLAAAALAGLGGWHAGCVVRDACFGTPSDLPWAFAQPGSSVTRHPVELYAAILFLSVAGFVAVWRKRARPVPGVAAGIALGMASFTRLITEPLRPTLNGGPAGWYIAGLIAGVGLAIWSWRRSNTTNSRGEGAVR
jgi:prolipoprotein diacylglyceryltransferase